MSFFIIIILLQQVSVLLGCQWTDHTGHTYHLDKLDKPEGWQIKDEQSGMGMFSMVYIFNFCDFHSVKCHDKQVAALEALAVMGQITENCDVAGQVETQLVQHIDEADPSKGILITYGLGDLCMDAKQQPSGVMQPRQSQFYIECGSNGKEFEVLPDSECVDKFRITHSIGCRTTSSHWFLEIICLIVLYMVAGFIYNRKKRQIEGEDAIPHIGVFRAMAPKVRSALHRVFEKGQTMYRQYRGGGYDHV